MLSPYKPNSLSGDVPVIISGFYSISSKQLKYFYSPLDGMFVHHKGNTLINTCACCSLACWKSSCCCLSYSSSRIPWWQKKITNLKQKQLQVAFTYTVYASGIIQQQLLKTLTLVCTSEKYLQYIKWAKVFEVNLFYINIRNTFLWMVKPGEQNHPHSRSICPVTGP